jgi:hypothetical protein
MLTDYERNREIYLARTHQYYAQLHLGLKETSP